MNNITRSRATPSSAIDRTSSLVSPINSRIVQRAAHACLVMPRVHANRLASRQIPQPGRAIGACAHQVGCIHAKHAVPHPSLVPYVDAGDQHITKPQHAPVSVRSRENVSRFHSLIVLSDDAVASCRTSGLIKHFNIYAAWMVCAEVQNHRGTESQRYRHNVQSCARSLYRGSKLAPGGALRMIRHT